MTSEEAHCLSLLRDADPDRYLACLWMPEQLRGPAAALYAFNAEITRIPALVSEPMPGEIRLQWWREVIGGERETGDQPVAMAVLDAIRRHDLPRATFEAYFDARLFDLYHDPVPDRAFLEGYAGETASALLQLTALCAGASAGRALADACGHGGVAQTIVAVLRSTPMHRRARRCYMPADMLASTGLDTQSWLSEPPDERHRNAVAAMTGWAREHYRKAVAAVAELEAENRPVFLPLAPVAAYLRAINRKETSLFDRPPELSPLHRHWLYWRAAARGLPSL